nr:GntR family transcriptional regulator [uncultured Sellimonas sp.]
MDYNVEIPIYMQVIRDLKKRIVRRQLHPGEKLPSNRELAVLYKVNPNTAARIYKEMEAEGYCYTKRGLGTFITEDEKMQEELRKEMADALLSGFLKEMQDLGFSRKEIISKIEEFDEEETA